MTPTSDTQPRRTPEPPDVSGWKVALWLSVLLLLVTGTAVGMSALLSLLQSRRAIVSTGLEVTDQHSREVQRRRLEQLRQEQRSRLESYGWVDRKNDVAHIPIERAMELLLESVKPDEEDLP